MIQDSDSQQMPETRSTEELMEGMKKTFSDIAEGRTESDTDTIRENVRRMRERRESSE